MPAKQKKQLRTSAYYEKTTNSDSFQQLSTSYYSLLSLTTSLEIRANLFAAQSAHCKFVINIFYKKKLGTESLIFFLDWYLYVFRKRLYSDENSFCTFG